MILQLINEDKTEMLSTGIPSVIWHYQSVVLDTASRLPHCQAKILILMIPISENVSSYLSY